VENGEFFLPTHDEVLRRVFRWLGKISPPDIPDLERFYRQVSEKLVAEVPRRLAPDGVFYFPEWNVLSKLISAMAEKPGVLRRYLPQLLRGYIQLSGRLAGMRASGREGVDFLVDLFRLAPDHPRRRREFRQVVYEVCLDPTLCKPLLWEQPEVRKARAVAARRLRQRSASER